MSKCIYCKHFANAKILSRKVPTGMPLKKKCRVKKKRITSESKWCKFFDPADTFHCNETNFRFNTLQCLSRRRNRVDLAAFEVCSSCRQFEQDVKALIEKYYLNASKPKVPKGFKQRQAVEIVVQGKTKRKLKRRKRVLKRRRTNGEKARVLKRRKKPVRKIKRRKK